MEPAAGEPAEVEGEADTGGTVPGSTVDIIAHSTKQVQTETSTQTEGEAPNIPASRNITGYFSAFLTDTCCGNFIQDLFLSNSPQPVDSDNIRGYGLFKPTDFLRGSDALLPGEDEDDYSTDLSYLVQAVVNGIDTGDLGTNHPIPSWVIGENDYMEWGRWKMTVAFNLGGNNYVIDNYGHYVGGLQTTDDRISSITEKTAKYSGNAYGRLWESGGPGVEMTGSFNTDVNFNTGSVSDFSLSVSGGGHSASISGANGSFGSSNFNIDPDTGTWNLDGTVLNTASHYMGAHGAFYGPNAEHTGGVWGLKKDSLNGAQGIFVGDKQ